MRKPACLGRKEFTSVVRGEKAGPRLGRDGTVPRLLQVTSPANVGRRAPHWTVGMDPSYASVTDKTHAFTAIHLLIFLLHFQPPPQIFARQVLELMFFSLNHQKAKKKA